MPKNTAPVVTAAPVTSADEDDHEKDTWEPTPAIFEAFLKRDFELAQRNVQMVMSARNAPMTLRDLKDCLLHSNDTIERVLSSQIVSGQVKEEKGRYERTGLGRGVLVR